HFDIGIDGRGLWKMLHRMSLGGAPVQTLTPECLLLYLCMHGSRHNWSRLLWVSDIAELLRACPEIDLARVFRQAERAGCERMLSVGLLLACDVGLQLPEETLLNIQSQSSLVALAERMREAQFGAGNSAWGSVDRYNARLEMRERAQDRMRLRLEHYHRKAVRMGRSLKPNELDHRLVSLPVIFSPLYYLVRPIRLAVHFGIARITEIFGNATGKRSQSNPRKVL